MNNKGFTLIELLTVIAIIAILAAITLVTFPMAQARAADARAINGMQQLRTAAEAYGGAYGTYTGMGTDPTVSSLVSEIEANIPGSVTLNITATTGVAYCASASLNAGSRTWCVDSTLFSGYDYVCGTGTVCATP